MLFWSAILDQPTVCAQVGSQSGRPWLQWLQMFATFLLLDLWPYRDRYRRCTDVSRLYFTMKLLFLSFPHSFSHGINTWLAFYFVFLFISFSFCFATVQFKTLSSSVLLLISWGRCTLAYQRPTPGPMARCGHKTSSKLFLLLFIIIGCGGCGGGGNKNRRRRS